jgi:thiamine biosynthesis protein ThiS
MVIRINGNERDVPEGIMLDALLRWLDLPLDRVAVERNLQVVPRGHWSGTPVEAGDQLEVVQLVGGGFGMPPR